MGREVNGRGRIRPGLDEATPKVRVRTSRDCGRLIGFPGTNGGARIGGDRIDSFAIPLDPGP
jgi:hypothetical protein